MKPINVDFVQKAKRVRRPFVMPQKGYLKIAVNVILTLVITAVAYYFLLPPINLHAVNFYTFIIGILIVYCVIAFFTSKATTSPDNRPYFKRQAYIPAVITGLLILFIIIGGLASCVLFRANSYKNLLSVENSI